MKPRVEHCETPGDCWWVVSGTPRHFESWEAALAYANEIAGLRATQPAWHRGEKEQP